jgi:TPR repeat protein
MNTNRLTLAICSFSVAAVLFCTTAISLAADFSGSYKNPQLSMEIVAAADGSYTGTIHMGSQDMPIKAHVDASGKLQGTFSSQGQNYTFSADLNGDQLTLQTGGANLQLTRAQNPLTGGGNSNSQPPNPIASNNNSNGNGDDGVALANEGNKYYYGDGVPKDYSRAMQLFQQSADKGCAPAMNQLACMYRDGNGTAQDYQMALKLFLQAAAIGDHVSECNAADLYQNGLGVPVDYNQAMILYRKSADGGYADAMNRIGVMYFKGQGVQKDPQQEFYWFQKAANGGDSDGMLDLGWAYQNGIGTPRDLDQARTWLTKAANLGNQDAKSMLASMSPPSAPGQGAPQTPAGAQQNSGSVFGKWAIAGDFGNQKFFITFGNDQSLTVEDSTGSSSSGTGWKLQGNAIIFDGSSSMNGLNVGGTWKMQWTTADSFTATDDSGKTYTLTRMAAN